MSFRNGGAGAARQCRARTFVPRTFEMTPEGRIQAQGSFKYGTDRGMFKRVNGGSGSNCASPDGMFCSRFEDGEQPVTTGTAVKTTYYVGNVEFIREGITNSTKRYIGGYLVITNVGNNAATFDYLLRDSLGSIDTIASEAGVMKSRQSFNAHGQRRTAATTSGAYGASGRRTRTFTTLQALTWLQPKTCRLVVSLITSFAIKIPRNVFQSQRRQPRLRQNNTSFSIRYFSKAEQSQSQTACVA